jgi:hypothetical protein
MTSRNLAWEENIANMIKFQISFEILHRNSQGKESLRNPTCKRVANINTVKVKVKVKLSLRLIN